MVKTAIQRAAELYEKQGLLLSTDLTNYLKYGFVFSGHDRLLIARAIDLARGPDFWLADQRGGNCWMVKMAVGEGCIPWFLSHIPFHKPFIAWRRDFLKPGGDLRVYKTERLLEKFNLRTLP